MHQHQLETRCLRVASPRKQQVVIIIIIIIACVMSCQAADIVDVHSAVRYFHCAYTRNGWL